MGNSPSTSVAKAPRVTKRPLDQQHDDDEHLKRPKIDAVPLKLVDVNFDCLETIFNQLDVEALVNVCEACEHFIQPATTVFSSRYRQKSVYLNLCSLQTDAADCIEVRKEIAGAFLRHFGQSISVLYFNCMAQRDIEIEKSLLAHCTDSLVNLELALCSLHSFGTINKPFEKVEQLSIVTSWLGEKLCRMNDWFPNIVTLSLSNVKLSNCHQFEVNFRQLKHLAINNNRVSIPMATIIAMLRHNPQLESLVLKCDIDEAFLQSINKQLPLLTKLALSSSEDRFHCFGDRKFSFEKVEQFTLSSFSHRDNFEVNMPFVFPALKELCLDGFNEFKGSLMNFIVQHRTITKLRLMPYINECDDLVYGDLAIIVDALPELIELEFCADSFTEDELIQFLSDNKQLQKVRLTFIDFPICAQLQASLNVNWSLDTYIIEDHCIGDYSESEHFYLDIQRKN